MTSYDLIWHLIELLLKNKEIKSDEKTQKKISNNHILLSIQYINIY